VSTERVRVLRAITRLNIGGPALHAAILTTRLDPRRFQSRLVVGATGRSEGSMLDTGRLGDLRATVVPSLQREISPLRDVRALGAISALIRHDAPHIVHTHLTKAGLVGRIAARAARTRVIVHTYHGSVFHGYFGAGTSRFYLLVEKFLARLSTRLIAITAGQREELVSLGVAPRGKIVVIPLGLDLDQFRSLPAPGEARIRLGLDGDTQVVLIVARLVPIKDVATFLRAFRLIGQTSAAHCVVVGDGEERAALELLARDLSLSDRCHFLGWQREMATLYAAADVVALSSLNEGSPVTLIEAMASGRPVVATRVGGVPDVVDETVGTLVPPRDAKALAGALTRLLADPDLSRRLGASGAERAFERFAAERLVADITRLYLELLDGA
jgi:glycosyltransferase involved in cell wall biosynthesis